MSTFFKLSKYLWSTCVFLFKLSIYYDIFIKYNLKHPGNARSPQAFPIAYSQTLNVHLSADWQLWFLVQQWLLGCTTSSRAEDRMAISFKAFQHVQDDSVSQVRHHLTEADGQQERLPVRTEAAKHPMMCDRQGRLLSAENYPAWSTHRAKVKKPCLRSMMQTITGH